MSPVPKSWYWKELKLAITTVLCSSSIVFFFLLHFYLASIICVAWSMFIVKNAYFKPVHLSIFYAKFFFEHLLERPDLLSQLRPLGLDLFNTQLHDYSVAFYDYQKRKHRRELSFLRTFQNQKMSVSERQSFDVMDYFMSVHSERDFSEEFGYHNYLINQMMGAQSEVVSFITKYHQILNLSDAEAYLLRVQRISKAFDQLIDQQKERRRRHIQTPRFVLQRVIRELEVFREQLKKEPNKSPLVIALVDKLTDQICSKEKQTDLTIRLLKSLQSDVSPAYDRLITVLHEDLSTAKTDHGVWGLPKGDEYYKLCLKYHTTTTMTAEEIHELGVTHVNRIQNEMRSILKEEQVETWHDFRTSLTNFENDVDQKYEDIEENRPVILQDYQRIIDEIDIEMGKYFSSACRPTTKCVVERVPQFKEVTSPAAYYFPAALDGKTPGTFFANLRNIDEVLKFKMRSLAYHEAVPGHHFQISVAQSLKHLPFFRRVVPFTAYVEGWALYTEQLALEKGFHKSWQSHLGYLNFELLRSCRLVVDTGIHWKRWSREQAIDYMTENTCMKKDEVVTEVERYFVYPGQACSYTVGCQTILSLRDKAQTALGENFDLKQFHDAVLLHGALPLNILKTIVEDFIKNVKSSCK